LSQEPLRADGGRDVGPQHLDRDLAAVAEVLGDVHRGHAAAAQLTVDRVAVAEGRRPALTHALRRGPLHRKESYLPKGIDGRQASMDVERWRDPRACAPRQPV